MSFDVACPVEQAFRVWTQDIGRWWPRDHSVSGSPERIVMETGVGGRIFERTVGGDEYEWGRVTVWKPPTELGYTWHLARPPAEATEVVVRFVPAESGTRVEIEHRGWEAVAEAGVWRERNRFGWQSLIPCFTSHLEGTP